jgi:tRNA (guanosine-2'-O-)-methyltransferase
MDRLSAEAFDPVRSLPRRPWGSAWTSQGVVEVLEPLVNAERRQRLRTVIEARIGSVTLLLDAPHDPHNGAAILRSCDAFGLSQMHVLTRHHSFLASNIVSRGTERWVDVIEHSEALTAVEQLRRAGFELVVADPRGELLPEQVRDLPRVALVLGNERSGVGDELLQSAGRSVRVPMVGFVESLNLSVSAALLMRAATLGRAGDLDLEERRTLYAQGLYRSLRRAADILNASSPR